jgi:hypothetical protein
MIEILSSKEVIILEKWLNTHIDSYDKNINPKSDYGKRLDFLDKSINVIYENKKNNIIYSSFYADKIFHVTYYSSNKKLYSWFEFDGKSNPFTIKKHKIYIYKIKLKNILYDRSGLRHK